MLRAIRIPERTLSETEYAHIDASDLWMAGSGYGEAGRQAYRQLAMLALLDPKRQVTATSTYLCMKLEGRYTDDHLRKVLRRMSDDDLVPVVEKNGNRVLRHVPVLSPEELTELERRLRVAGKRRSNVREARRKQNEYHDYVRAALADVLTG
jgi:hypothetical protein